MAIEFDIYPSPSSSGEDGKTTYHARVVNGETIATNEIAQSIHKRCTLTMSNIKAVDFRADTSLKKDLAEKAQFKRTEHKHRSASLGIYEIDALLVDYFETNQYLTRRRFEQLCDFTSFTAARHLKRLLDEGRLKNTNTKQNPVYEPVKGYYGK